MDKLHHIAVSVDNIEEAVAWYENAFDVTPSYVDETWAMLDFENLSLALVLPHQHPPHLALESAHPESYGSLQKHRDGTASVYVKDPWGNVIELIRTKS